MKFTPGVPEKNVLKQYVFQFRRRPCAVGMQNNCENSWVVAVPQCEINNNEPYDCYYEIDWFEDDEIKGYCELP